jgi:PAS domain S-box-containing protein
MFSVPTHVAVDEVLPPEATSAGQARRLLRDALSGLESEDSVDAAQMAVSEIVTNALVHAGTPMRFRVLLGTSGVRVELGDGSPHLPHQRDYSEVASTGRGLHVVGEVVDRWGAFPSGGGKVVWFEIADGQDHYADESEPIVVDPDAPIEVELLNVPLLMHAAWQEHAAALLRELLLVRLDEDDTAIEHHAAASEALSVLFEQIPAPDLGDDPEAIMAVATEPGVSRTRLTLRIQPASMPHFEVLDSALVEAVEMADLGQLLSPPTQPEIQYMRHWICEQVRSQATGGLGAAWASPTDAVAPGSVAQLEWDDATVGESSRAVIAADDTNQIVATSPALLTMLGYADARGLVGQRLVSIIPTRFHQAHIAGFTLHLVNGRSPLLGNRVRVPVMRADGTEIDVELQIESVPLPSGRRVFTAELFA